MVEEERKQEPVRSPGKERLRGVLLFLLVITINGSALWLTGLALGSEGTALLLVFVPIVLYGLWRGARDAWFHGGRWLKSTLIPFVLVVMVAVGLVVNQFELKAKCINNPCDLQTPYRALAVPEVYGLLILHVLAVVAYAVSRRRPEALRPRAEALVAGTLACGILLHVALGLQFFKVLPQAVLLPFTFPVLTPYITLVLFGRELVSRLWRRGLERAHDPEGLHPAIGMTAAFHVVLGAWGLLDALLFGRADAAWRTFSRTCGHTLSTLPIVDVPGNCHYLCTVAARGHAWLVRPERVGSRRGVPIVVNRQLAIANAFEDLLIARVPRFARGCRALYDRFGMPVSRWLRHPLACDLVYVAMKPAEWAFYLALLLFDRTDPEPRIERMYSARGVGQADPQGASAH
jgi:hypothetical protein